MQDTVLPPHTGSTDKEAYVALFTCWTKNMESSGPSHDNEACLTPPESKTKLINHATSSTHADCSVPAVPVPVVVNPAVHSRQPVLVPLAFPDWEKYFTAHTVHADWPDPGVPPPAVVYPELHAVHATLPGVE